MANDNDRPALRVGGGLYRLSELRSVQSCNRRARFDTLIDRQITSGPTLSELTAFFDAFAYRPATRESLDHVSVEAGFVGYLRLKEAYAMTRGDDDQAAVTAEAAATFIREHLAVLAEPLAATLDASGVAYLADAARALADRVGPPPSATASPMAARLLPVIQPLEDEDEIACDGTGGTDV